MDQTGDVPADGPARASAAVEAALTGAGLAASRPAPGEWGVVLVGAGEPVEVGLALRDGLLRVVAFACPPGLVPSAWLLHRNRRDLALVRYGTGLDGAVWVHGDLPPVGLVAATVDALLARTLEAVDAARGAPAARGAAAARR